MGGVNSRFAKVSEAEILQIPDKAVSENTKKATKYGLKVFEGKRKQRAYAQPLFLASMGFQFL